MNTKAAIRSKENFLVFGSPKIEQTEIDEVVSVMQSGWLGTGPKVAEFENHFADYKQAAHAIALNSCTAALHLSILAAGIKPGDEVITTPLTFCATINAIVHAGATPVLADIDPVTMNINPSHIEAKITAKTRAILPVHFAGRPCEMDKLCELANNNNIKLIEDCAHAIEAKYKGQKIGTFGDFGCFSFYVTKNITTGEGGMVITNNEDDATRVKILALHGMSKDAWRRFDDEGYKHYKVVEIGYKYNMMDLQAAIGLSQLRQVDIYWQKRQQIWNTYQSAFQSLPMTLPAVPQTATKHAYHLYTILIDEHKTGLSRDQFVNRMNAHHIGVGIHYLSIPEHPFYQKKYHWQAEDYPVAMRIGRQTVSLPLSAKLTDQDVRDVINAVTEILSTTQ